MSYGPDIHALIAHAADYLSSAWFNIRSLQRDG
jgi:hypothetical protein